MKANTYIISIVIGVLGLVLAIAPGATTILVCRIIGVALLLTAFSSIFFSTREEEKPYFKGVALSGGFISGVLGLFFIINPMFVMSIIPWVAGVVVFINGCINVFQAIQIGKQGGSMGVHLVMGILTAGLGVLIFSNPFGAVELTIRVIGIVLVVDAVTNIFTTRTYYTQID